MVRLNYIQHHNQSLFRHSAVIQHLTLHQVFSVYQDCCYSGSQILFYYKLEMSIDSQITVIKFANIPQPPNSCFSRFNLKKNVDWDAPIIVILTTRPRCFNIDDKQKVFPKATWPNSKQIMHLQRHFRIKICFDFRGHHLNRCDIFFIVTVIMSNRRLFQAFFAFT